MVLFAKTEQNENHVGTSFFETKLRRSYRIHMYYVICYVYIHLILLQSLLPICIYLSPIINHSNAYKYYN